MEQIPKNKLCYYCLGCNAEESANFTPRMNCENFIPGVDDWYNVFRENLKNKEDN